MRLLNQMKGSGVAPDLVTFNAALHGAQRAASLARPQLLTQMRDRDIARTRLVRLRDWCLPKGSASRPGGPPTGRGDGR